MKEDYYKILGINKSASKDDVKKAFHKMAHKYHPDKKGGDEALFKKASEAYTVLSDDKKRSEYDSYGRVFSDGSGGGQGFDFNDFGGQGFDFSQFAQQAQGGNVEFDLGDLFGGMFGGRGARTKRGNDISVDIELPFKDAIFGVNRKISLTKNSVCEDCDGSGAKAGSEMVSCSICNGKGQIHETKRSILGTFSTVKTCDTCNGKGRVAKDKCKSCAGYGINKKQSEISINIPSGINNGEMIRLAGAGEAISGGMSGDLYIKVHVTPDKNFRKEGFNLVTDLNIKLTDALLGAEYNLDTLDGKLKLQIPAGVTIGEVLRIKGRGVPTGGTKRGDILVKLNIQLPTKLNRKASKLVSELRKEGV
ncbi:DnaJ domain-containing protein [Patescibacteria group bacterium]|nr:DnaJ domain-containing protein [Patescibacteria group bacterium]MCG2694578.1 DnaJ domain-containing protein [Candidatus Parcubacteria bacterium]